MVNQSGPWRMPQSGLCPDVVEIADRQVRLGGEWVAALAVVGYPRDVGPGWLQPLLTYPARLDVSVHIEPIDPRAAATRLRKQLGKLESDRQQTATGGRLADSSVDAATEDAYELSDRLARSETRLYRIGLYLTVHAASEVELAEEVSAVRALTSSMLLDAVPTTYRAMQGWAATLPVATDEIGLTRTVDTDALASAFPFTSPDLPPPTPTSAQTADGVLYGYNLGSQSLVHWDRFACDNYNSVILGRSGAGKSYLVKLEALRSLYRGIEVAIIDPEDEYATLAEAVGGVYVPLGADGTRINPLDIPTYRRADGRLGAAADALQRRMLFVHTVLATLFGTDLTADERAVVDPAITATYQHAGITDDPRTWQHPAPLLADLHTTLAASDNDTARSLAARLHPYTHGAYAGLFGRPTSGDHDSHLLVYSLRQLPDELKSVGTLLAMDAVWHRISNPATRRPRLCVVDEAWLLMRQAAGAEFLWRMAKSGRKHWAGLTVATQDVADVLASDLGQSILTNASTQILLRQSPQAIDDIVASFGLSEGERHILLTADTGQGLLASGTHRVAVQAVASPTEHALITTDPAELATQPATAPSGELILD